MHEPKHTLTPLAIVAAFSFAVILPVSLLSMLAAYILVGVMIAAEVYWLWAVFGKLAAQECADIAREKAAR